MILVLLVITLVKDVMTTDRTNVCLVMPTISGTPPMEDVYVIRVITTKTVHNDAFNAIIHVCLAQALQLMIAYNARCNLDEHFKSLTTLVHATTDISITINHFVKNVTDLA